MKKLISCLVTALILTAATPTIATITDPVSTASVRVTEKARVDALLSRLNEIKAMDKSSMTYSEKKQLRREVRAAKAEIREVGGGVYISVGALLITLLLILLL